MLESIFLQLVATVVFLIPIVFGLVNFLKDALKLDGNAVRIMSFIVGVLFGGLAFLAYLFPDWGVYIAGSIFILSLGLVASGYYDYNTRNDPGK